ncbi:putative Tyrosine-protein phosphatase non-receptor type, partial [Operophtera brumata]
RSQPAPRHVADGARAAPRLDRRSLAARPQIAVSPHPVTSQTEPAPRHVTPGPTLTRSQTSTIYETHNQETVTEEPAVCFVPLSSIKLEGDVLEQSMLLLGDGLANGAALTQYDTLQRRIPEETDQTVTTSTLPTSTWRYPTRILFSAILLHKVTTIYC